MGVEIYGVDEWKKEATKVIKNFPEKGAQFIDEQSKKLAARVRQKTPKGPTGKLKKSWRKTKARPKKGTIRGEVKSSAPHAHLIEYGHIIKNRKNGPALGFVAGQHILKTSLDQLDREWDGELAIWFQKLIREVEV